MCMLVYVTAPDEKTAHMLADNLLKNNLAAGINISCQCRSIYRWRGEIKQKNELQLFIQINAGDYSKVEDCIRKLHPYEEPCILGLPIQAGFDKFLNWMENRGHERENCPDRP